MRHVRMLGLCLAAAFAVCAYAVSSASALPEWGKCEAKAGGKYENSNCTVKAKGKTGKHEYEWLKASQVAAKREAEGKSRDIPFTGHSVGSGGVLTSADRACFEISGPITRQKCKEERASKGEEYREYDGGGARLYVECANETSSGEAVAKNKVGNVHVIFTGCKALGQIPCSSAGKAEGEVETNPLKGELGYINRSAKEVGVLLEPAQKHGLFASFGCSGVLAMSVGVGSKKQGAEFTSSGCFGAYEPEIPGSGCPGATPGEEAHGGYDGIISPITPVNTMTSSFEQVYTVESKYPYRNIPSKFEGKHIDLLEDTITQVPTNETTDWTSAGEEIKNVNTPEEEGEIKA